MAEATQWGLAARRATLAALLYFVVLLAAAGSSRFSSGKEPALLVWIGGTLLLLILLLYLARQTSVLTGPLLRAMVVVGSIATVVAVLSFLGFVVMVNVWELLGLGH